MKRPPFPEVTEVICRVPSTSFSQAPWYTLPAHLCRFGVRTIRWGYFPGVPGSPHNPISVNYFRPPSLPSRLTNINVISIDYAFRPRLRIPAHPARINLAQEPLGFRRQGLSPCLSLLMSAFSLLIPPSDLTVELRRLTERSATACTKYTPEASVHCLSPVTSLARELLFRPVSYYAFFKGWLLLSQPPGCFGVFTSFLSLSNDLGTLAVGLGFFPLDDGPYHPPSDSYGKTLRYSEFG